MGFAMVEKQMEKNMEHQMETGSIVIKGFPKSGVPF